MDKNIFTIDSDNAFEMKALAVFRFQYKNNAVYREYVNRLGLDASKIERFSGIPYLPVEFFKTHKVLCGTDYQQIFRSSGTSGYGQSRHYIADVSLYEQSFLHAFRYFYGHESEFCILALLPSYLEREGSSLIFMVETLIRNSENEHSGFYLYDYKKLAEKIVSLEKDRQKTLLLGVSYALLDVIDKYRFNLQNTIVMETGGMKGKRREMTRQELHTALCKGFGVKTIHSEYGMTELLSQAYSKGKGLFTPPPWMKIRIREINDPFNYCEAGRSGGINIADLANIHSCSFIETQDVGKCYPNGSFEVSGRFDHSDTRGCNLLVAGG